ncbi:Ca2+-transporting ATPase [Gillisia mitskevichiae]|uniref:Ca2+-transporting ATPase n=1 Tax=Gillisia mitskevichiae TaxID=270921 RepID=A0A495PUR3_9FLAO|nr:cation-translocating P-type ATPase [Gillisia mitskevichiae]RKS53736.1 Ca2+-transporting ATPase [Gillisia mitskevichiae]
MAINTFGIVGLNKEEVLSSRLKHGSNTIAFKKKNQIIEALKSLIKEPMVLLLLAASSIYFIVGEIGDGIFLAVAIVLVATISLYQNSKSKTALDKLKKITQPNCNVIREAEVSTIAIEELVVGDSIMVEEGTTIPADASIVHSNDFLVNESLLTGESFSIYKDQNKDNNLIFMGSYVTGGLAIATVTAIGANTKLGEIGKSVEEIDQEKTPLENQINNFVKKMILGGTLFFIIVWILNYRVSLSLLDSFLKALTLAMSILPEEIPVAFTTFMALGAWRLMKQGVIVKQMKTVESLGSATVICVDKTGTITQNRMSLVSIYSIGTKEYQDPKKPLNEAGKELIRFSMWASEPIPFDPMEVALHEAYSNTYSVDERKDYKMIHEYPLGGKPPMMTHIFQNSKGEKIIAAKGAPEAFLDISNLDSGEKEEILEVIKNLAKKGYRVLGVGVADFSGENWPKLQQEFKFEYKGLVAFYDPPKKNIEHVFQGFYKAGINVKIITGDIAETSMAIAKETGFKGFEKHMTGDQLMKLSDSEIQEEVLTTQLFTRMFPEAKLRIINALKVKGEIVAMTGDGINDAPALKAAHIGIAMGKKGTEIAKQAASLILLEDDLEKMVDAIAMGRRIYTNLKKAIQYIISIHIPIILIVSIPLILGWIYPNIFSPIHIILLELIMGPTCSIVYENEPIEKDIMTKKPRPISATFFNWKELTTSVLQGLVITLGTLGIYQFSISSGYDEATTRTMVFTTLISANIFLTFVNRSFYYSSLTTFKYENKLIPLIIGITLGITAMLLFIPAFTRFFEFELLNLYQIILSVSIGLISVIWYELVKWRKRSQHRIQSNQVSFN